MNFNENVDPALQTLFLPLSSTVEFFAQHDFDLSIDSPIFSFPSSTTCHKTLQPSQLRESSPTWSSPPAMSPTCGSCNNDFGFTSSQSHFPKKKPHSTHNGETKDHAGHHKRHQTKLACSWCRKLSKKCDAQRPCGRCVQFNRCSECVDAPPRRPRAKGIDRGTYKKTRELAITDYQTAFNRREAYVAKQAKKGREVRVGLTPDEIQKRKISSETTEVHDVLKPQLLTNDDDSLASGFPLASSLEDWFTYPTSPEVDEAVFTPSAFVLTPSSSCDEIISPPPSPLFEISSPDIDSHTISDYDHSDFTAWQWQTMQQNPTVKEFAASAQAGDRSTRFSTEELQLWSDSLF
jgi:hypothetical protein